MSKDFTYCPFCGTNVKDVERREKEAREAREFEGLAAMSMAFPFGKLFDELTKEFSREIDKMWEEEFAEPAAKKIRRRGISISISTEGGEPKVRVRTMGEPLQTAQAVQAVQARTRLPQRILSEEEVTKYAKLPRKEAETTVKRFSDKIVYEILLPNVERLENVFVNKLHNSIEIKAFGKDKAFFKLIPLDLNVKNYFLQNGKLILELVE